MPNKRKKLNDKDPIKKNIKMLIIQQRKLIMRQLKIFKLQKLKI